MSNNSVLENLEPKGIFRFFGEILSIPRPSKHEGQMSDYLVKWAEERGLEHERDSVGNVIIYACRHTWIWFARKTVTRSSIFTRMR